MRDSPKVLPDAGAYLRSSQIAELVTHAGHGIVDLVENGAHPIGWRERLDRWRTIRHLRLRADTGDSGRRFFRKRSAMHFRLMSQLIDAVPNADCFLWEQTQRHGTLAAARERGLPTIALPHNIESVVGSEQLMYVDGDVHTRFAAECAELARADHRVVICERDRWLLALFGLDSTVLPYYPARARYALLDDVRRMRLPSADSVRLLVMGTAHYPPNFRGMQALLKLLEAGIPGRADVVIDVMGVGTERLADACAAPGITFHGAVSSEDLLAHMSVTSAAVIYQDTATTGALTRIPDYLIAGVPVLANRMAARSYEHLEGVHLFENADDLAELLSTTDLVTLPAQPLFPAQAVRTFIDYIGRGE